MIPNHPGIRHGPQASSTCATSKATSEPGSVGVGCCFSGENFVGSMFSSRGKLPRSAAPSGKYDDATGGAERLDRT